MSLYQAFYGLVALTCLLWVLVLRSGFDRREIRLAIGGVLCVIALWMWEISEPMILFSDFTTAYYPAGRAIRDDLPHLYRRCWDTPVCGFVNLPIVALLFTPFSFFTLRHAQWLFAAFSLVSVGMSLYLLWSVSKRDPRRKWAMLLLFAMNGPLFYSLKEGNLTHFVLLLLIAGVVCLHKTWDRRAGLCFAAAAIIKLPLLLFLLYFAAKRRWPVVQGYAATLAVVSSLSMGYAGWASHVEWYHKALEPFSDKGLSAFNVQSLQGVLLRLHNDAGLYDWKPIAVGWKVKVIALASTALLITISGMLILKFQGKRVREATNLELSMVLCLALIISPVSWTHYYLLLLLPLALYAGNRLPIPQSNVGTLGMLACVLLVSPPVTVIGQQSLLGEQAARWLLAHYLLGGIILWGLLSYARWHLAKTEVVRMLRAEWRNRATAQLRKRPKHEAFVAPSDRQAAG